MSYSERYLCGHILMMRYFLILLRYSRSLGIDLDFQTFECYIRLSVKHMKSMLDGTTNGSNSLS